MRRRINFKKTKISEELNRAFEEGRVIMFDIRKELNDLALQNMSMLWEYGIGNFLYEDGSLVAETSSGIRMARKVSKAVKDYCEECDICRELLQKSGKELNALGWKFHRVYDGDPFAEKVEEHVVFVKNEFDKKYLGFRRKGVPICEIMNMLVWEDIQGKPNRETATAHVMKRSELDFELYDVATDCINPITGKPLVNFMDSSLERFYSFRNNEIDYDADASLEANIIYEKLFSFVNRPDKKVIRPQRDNDGRYNRFGLKFELGEPGCTGGLSYRGDTMNSVATTNRAYYWAHKEMHGSDFVWPKEALELMDVYHTPGNFMVLPYRIGFGINQTRGTGNTKDYFDLFLLAIYNFFLEMHGKDGDYDVNLGYVLKYDSEQIMIMSDYLRPFVEEDRRRFLEHDCQLIDDIADTSMLISNVTPGWEAFIEDNLLQDFVEPNEFGHYGRPKELWTNHFCTYGKCCGVPYREEQFMEFWTNAANRIQARSRRIYKMLNND